MMNDLFGNIKSRRIRHASQIKDVVNDVILCIDYINSLNPKIKEVIHKDRTYLWFSANVNSRERVTRPFRNDIICFNKKEYVEIANNAFEGNWHEDKAQDLERFIYTSQQIIGCYLDLYNPSAARRVVGTLFECLVACSLNRSCGLTVGSGTVKIKEYNASIRTDLGLYENEHLKVLVATKTSTRERLSQPFVQKFIVDRAKNNPPKTLLIAVGDVQRVGKKNVQHTFTAGQLLLYWNYITKMDGIYFIDLPPQATGAQYQDKVKRLYRLFGSDIHGFIS